LSTTSFLARGLLFLKSGLKKFASIHKLTFDIQKSTFGMTVEKPGGFFRIVLGFKTIYLANLSVISISDPSCRGLLIIQLHIEVLI